MGKKIFLAAAISLIASLPLLHKGLPPTHDGEYHVIRFYEFNKTLFDGNFYPRWAPDLNNAFGVPLFNYVYPLPNYVASFLNIFNFSFIDAFKLNLFFASILGTVFFFLWTRQFWGDLGGIVSSTFYAFSPYHLLDIYIRGSVGEVWALAFLPGFLWTITKFIKEKDNLFGLLSSIFLSMLIFSHNILALMFFPFALSYIFFLIIPAKNRKYLIRYTFYLILLGLGLASIFWLPAIFERGFVRGLEIYDYSSNFPEFYQLLIPSWGSGFAGGDLQNQLSFQIGLANLLVIFLSLILLFKKIENRRILYFFLAAFFILFLLMLKISEPVWKIIPFMNYFQFPWRLLSLIIVSCSFIAGGIVLLWKQRIMAVLLMVLTISLGIGYANFAYYHQRDDKYYISRSNFIDGTNSPGNTFNTFWAGDLKKKKNKVEVIEGKISELKLSSTKYTFKTNLTKETNVLVNTAYFPGWSVYVDNRPTKINIEKEGNFSFRISQGFHKILVQFEDTPVRKSAAFLSVLSAFILLNTVGFVKIKR